jgi:predicted peptidase
VLLDEVIKRNDIDEERVYITGLSMGGFGTWDLAAYSPERFAAIAPICGGGNTLDGKLLINLPAWVFHGAEDKVVPASFSESMVTAIRRAGGGPKITIYPHTGHDSWTETYENPKLYAWLLKKQRRKNKSRSD